MLLIDEKRRITPGVTCALLLFMLNLIPGLTARPVSAQDWGIPPTVLRPTPVPDYAQLVLNELNRPVQLTMVDGSVLRGVVGGADAAEFTLLLDGLTLMESRVGISWARINEVRIERRSRMIEGLLLGGAGGALVGALSPLDDDTGRKYLGVEAPQHTWDTALQGAVIGALVGLLNGVDFVLPHTPQSFGTVGPGVPSRQRSRPSVRVITTAPSQSLTIRDIEESLEASPSARGASAYSDQAWNGHNGSTLAMETSWRWDQRWWLRSRIEWTSLPRVSLKSPFGYDGPPTTHLERDYRSWRTLVGLALPMGGVGRLPIIEVAFLAGLSRTKLESRVYSGSEPSPIPPLDPVNTTQSVYRPIIMASASLALLRRPKLAVGLRAEGVMGMGFTANALTTVSGYEIIPKKRITPIGLSIGIEVLFPNF